MPKSSESRVEPSPVPPLPRRVFPASPDLERELLQAMQDFERGDYIELTIEELEHCAATGEWPWPGESPS